MPAGSYVDRRPEGRARHGVMLGVVLLPLLLAWGCFGGPPPEADAPVVTEAPRIGPSSGALVVAGGGTLGPEIWERFLELAGGPEALIVVIPTAGADDHFDNGWSGLEPLRRAGALNLRVLHTRDPAEADDPTFTAPLAEAGGVWFPGGRQWRLVDAYLGTRVHDELFRILERGGVVGGTSAGASIQASFLVRGDPETNQILLSPEYEEGFGLLSGTAVDQHLLARGREDDLWELLALRPDLLGIGIDEGTALVIQGDRAEVVGSSQALFYDPNGPIRRARSLRSGAIFDLGQRAPLPRAVQDINEQQDGQGSPLQP